MATPMDVAAGAPEGGEALPTVVEESVEVIVHPLVLLSTVDHYNRVAKDTKKRVVGVLLGTTWRGRIDITNSFAVPFEEDLKNPMIWYLDHNYLESMFYMFKKINAKERIVGFYSTGPKIKENDLQIDELFRRFSSNPVFVIIDVRPGVEGIPVTAYRSKEEVEQDGKEIQRTFEHIPSSVGALEAEEVGVEHLLRDINDPSVSTLANQIKHKMVALSGLKEKLLEIHAYLQHILDGKMPVNNQIIYNLQNIFNLLPNLNVEDLIKGLMVKTNDMHFIIYLSSLIRAVVALHDVVQNKIQYATSDEIENGNAKDKAAGGKEKSEEGGGEKKGEGGGEGKEDKGSSSKKDGGGEKKDGGEKKKKAAEGGKGEGKKK